MNKTIPALVVVAILLVVAFILFKQPAEKPGRTRMPLAGTTTVDSQGLPAIAIPSALPTPPPTVDSMVSRLAGKSMIVVDVLPRNVDVMVRPATEYYTHLAATKVWKHYQPDSLLKASAEKAGEENTNLAPFSALMSTGHLPPQVKEIWNSLAEIALAVSTKTIPVDVNGKHVDAPPIALIVKFASDEAAKKYGTEILSTIEPYKAQAQAAGAQFSEPSPGSLDVSAMIPGMTQPLVASLVMRSPNIMLLLGTRDPLDFFEPKGSIPSSAQILTSRSWMPKPAVAGSFQMQSFMSLIEGIFTASLPPGSDTSQQKEQFKKVFQMYEGTKLAVFSLGLDSGGYRQQGCIELTPGTPIESMYDAMIAKPGAVSFAARLSDDQTLAAFDYPIAAVQHAWKMFDTDEITKIFPPDKQASADAFRQLNSTFAKFDFQTATAVVATPPSGAMPRAALVLSGAKLSKDALLQEFVSSANELLTLAQKSQGGSPAETPAVTLDKSGQSPVIRIQAGLIQVVGRLAGENGLVFGLDPFYLAKVADKLNDVPSYDYLSNRIPQAKRELAKASQVSYFNLGLSLQIFKPWVTTLIPAQANLTNEELDEVIQAMSTGVVSTQSFERFEGNVICSTAMVYQG